MSFSSLANFSCQATLSCAERRWGEGREGERSQWGTQRPWCTAHCARNELLLPNLTTQLGLIGMRGYGRLRAAS